MFPDDPPADPLELFASWYQDAWDSEINDPNAMAVATVGEDGMPSVRMVLLKGYDHDGFVFYTNLESRKGVQLRTHPKAAFVMHWKSLRRQVRVEGHVSQVGDAEADEYFASRAHGSQVGAWASKQSRPLESKHALKKRVAEYGTRYAVGPVPRPPEWSGFRISPTRIEFWEEGRFRLHNRLVYEPDDAGGWTTTMLYP
ncbi:Pyridoxamine 5'-phosphate oxidase [Limimonas halophila]|uniref:Pyridoxine/pyridoxamine 5'-phosphate oxidase n=1 Tax=Limimonas halophila TaxID=1082479 RepID=A0A1G7PWG3_9PROT|nr:pyridoxamine 5'-phosphate oxidase [Limimonas halophila]SDF90545.1 Pyridoxamine 5'-phosphate oxidase [Limimonas halophila]